MGVEKNHLKNEKIIEHFDGVQKNRPKNENYRKFRWCRKCVSKFMQITENFDGVEKNHLKNEKIIEHFDGVQKNCQKMFQNYEKLSKMRENVFKIMKSLQKSSKI